jgi:hypothetical protein
MKFGEKKRWVSLWDRGAKGWVSGSDHNRISSGWFFDGTCMVFMMLQAVICVIILI